jgi:hypothetical protein
MQLNLAFFDSAQPPSGRPPTSPPFWGQLDEAARLAALARLIAECAAYASRTIASPVCTPIGRSPCPFSFKG